MSELSEAHRKRLADLIDGWECAARISDEIVKAFQPELDEFTASGRDNTKTYDIRLIRAVVDEKSARDRFLKDAEALRAALDTLPSPPRTTPAEGE